MLLIVFDVFALHGWVRIGEPLVVVAIYGSLLNRWSGHQLAQILGARPPADPSEEPDI